MALDLFTETGRKSRSKNTARLLGLPQQDDLQGAFGVYDSTPAQSIAPVDNAGAEVPVESFQNQINPDASVAFPVMEGFQEYITGAMRNGTDFLGTPSPYLNYEQEVDQQTGDAISRSLAADYSGVPDAVRAMSELYLEPISGRLNRSISDENAARKKAKDAAPVRYYDRSTGQYVNLGDQDPRTLAQNRNISIAPYFPIESLFI
jgi:hypothetical protein